MKKYEVFAAVAGVIGFVVDLITLTNYLQLRNGITVASHVAVVVTALYSWFLLTWFLVRRSYLRRKEVPIPKRSYSFPRRQTQKKWSLFSCSTGVVIGLGILALPIAMKVEYQWAIDFGNSGTVKADMVQSALGVLIIAILSTLFAGLCILYAVDFLMPVIYEDMAEHE